jgi:hypothetical protein
MKRQRGVTEILESIDFRLRRLEHHFIPVGAALTIKLLGTIDGKTKELKMLPLPLGKKCLISVEGIVDAAGNPAKVQDDKLEFSLSDESFGALEVVDGMSALFAASGKVGVVKVYAKGDADLGEGVVEIIGEGEIDCLSGQAILIKLKLEVAPDPV